MNKPPVLDVSNLVAMQVGVAQRASRPRRGKVLLNPTSVSSIAGDSSTVTLMDMPKGSRITGVEIGGGQPPLQWIPAGPLSGVATLQANVIAPLVGPIPGGKFVMVKVYYTEPDGTFRIACEELGIR